MQKKDLKNFIKKYLTGLCLLQSEDISVIESRLDDLSEQALEEILAVLKEGMEKQNDFFVKMNAKDKKFNLNLEKFMKNSYKEVVNKFTEQEQKDASEILKQL